MDRKKTMHLTIRNSLLVAAVALPAASTPAFAQNTGLRAGAARVESTPAVADLPDWFKTVNDKLYVRAVVLDDGASRAVILVADAPTIATDVSADLARRIAAMANVPVANVLVAVTPNHNAVRVDDVVQGVYLPGSPQITAQPVAKPLEGVKQAPGKP